MKTLFILILIVNVSISTFSQECLTDNNVPDYFATHSSQSPTRSGGYTVRVAAHIFSDNNCQQGFTTAQLNFALQTLENDLSPHNICISLVRVITVCDSLLAFGGVNSFNSYPSTDAIDIYFNSPYYISAGGYAPTIPATHFSIYGTNTPLTGGQPVVMTHVISHEFGHCLGLFHTYHGATQVTGEGGCPELVNGTCIIDTITQNCNGSSCGDFVPDTPVDPYMTNIQVDSNTCLFQLTLFDPANALYVPDTRNIMSKTHAKCQDRFTIGQGTRMKIHLDSIPTLRNCLIPDDVFVQNLSSSLGGINYISSQSITAGNNVIIPPLTNGNVEFTNTSGVLFKAAGCINLESGFSASPTNVVGPTDGFFRAEIDPNICGFIQGINSSRIAIKRNNSFIPSTWLYTLFGPDGNVSKYAMTQNDSIINGYLYKRIKEEVVAIPGLLTDPFVSGISYKYLRFDTISNKVFSLVNGQDQLLYDYNLNIGDSLPAPLIHRYSVVTIDTVQVASGFRKRWIFEDLNGTTVVWIYGIGNVADPFANASLYNQGGYVLCYHEQGSLIYEDQSIVPVQCNNFNSINENNDELGFHLFPNPTNKTIFYNSNYNVIDKVEIFDITSQIIYNIDNPSSEGSINLERVSAGIYYFKCTINNKNVVVKKIIKN